MRKAGIAGIERKELQKKEFNKISLKVKSDELEKYQELLAKFQEKLREFSSKYSREIKEEKEFRSSFLDICSKIGVDPLSSSKGIWSFLGLGDYYYELLVKILEIALATSPRNGGLISLERVKELLSRDFKVSEQDIQKALCNIQVLGNGLELFELNSSIYLGSVPREFNKDLLLLLEFAQSQSKITCIQVEKEFKWQEERVSRAIENLVKEGLFWVDEQVEPVEYALIPVI